MNLNVECSHRAWKTLRVFHCLHSPDDYLPTIESVKDVLAQVVNHVLALDTSGAGIGAIADHSLEGAGIGGAIGAVGGAVVGLLLRGQQVLWLEGLP